MLFSEFIATRRRSEDLRQDLPDQDITDQMGNADAPIPGWIYWDQLWIVEQVDSSEYREQGKFWLFVERDDYMLDDLGTLEAILFAWAIHGCGILEIEAPKVQS